MIYLKPVTLEDRQLEWLNGAMVQSLDYPLLLITMRHFNFSGFKMQDVIMASRFFLRGQEMFKLCENYGQPFEYNRKAWLEEGDEIFKEHWQGFIMPFAVWVSGVLVKTGVRCFVAPSWSPDEPVVFWNLNRGSINDYYKTLMN